MGEDGKGPGRRLRGALSAALRDGPKYYEELMAAIGKLAEEQMRAGKLVAMGGLGWGLPSTRVTIEGEKLSQTDGPFPETKELLAGFAIFELPSKEEAVKAAQDFLKVHREVLGPSYQGTVDVHPIF